jgi:hypothetical protein
VHHYTVRPLCDRTRGPNRYRAIDDGQCWPEQLDVAGALACEIPDLERITDMQDINSVNSDGLRRNVHANRLMMFRNQRIERLAHLSKSDDDNFTFPVHGISSPLSRLSRFQ